MQAANNLNESIEKAISIKYYKYKNFYNVEKIGNSDSEEIYSTNLKNSEQYFTLKSFDFNDITMKEITHELELHHKIVHRNIIQLFGITEKVNEDNQKKEHLLVMEYAGDNTLQNYLKEGYKNLTRENKYNLAYQLVCTISWLHDKEIVHGDLNSSYILVYKDIIKLTDFGLSKRIKEASNQKSDMIPYIDPKKFAISNKMYLLNKKSDVYSIGVLLWEISSGQPPFKDEIYDANLATKILQGYREKIVPNTLINYSNLYIECWNCEPDDRPDMIQVFAKLKEIITKSVNFKQLLSIQQFNNVKNINIDNNNILQINQNFDKISIKEIEPKTQNINKYIFEEDLSFVVDELVDLYFEEVNKGKEEKMRKQDILNYIDNNELKLQEIHEWLINNQDGSNFYYLLGYFNFQGIIGEANKQEASELFQKAAKLGNNAAQYNLANMYIDGEGVDKDYKKAFELSLGLAEKEYLSGINLLGYCYKYGIGTDINEQKSFESYQKAANLGNSNGLNNLGICYEYGTGTDIDEQKAFELYQEAANLGNANGMNSLGFCYENGAGTDINEQKAFELYQKAADLGNASGTNSLGCCYEKGVGTDIDIQKAFELYQLAANLGNDHAQFNLALMYEFGKGIEKDINKATYWYIKSAEQGYDEAQDKLEKILNNL
ncbi:kinase-like domain-containing protein [Rhizophagus diaphanus]|nr:kinase-like domain-containing protein [Rhizophagus diaphanus] [Rhizophagus sp. MUCL 43196]